MPIISASSPLPLHFSHLLVLIFVMATSTSSGLDSSSSSTKLNIAMPGVKPNRADEYICTALPVPSSSLSDRGPGLSADWYITGFEPQANMSVAHHVLLYGCQEPYSFDESYPCGQICAGMGPSRIIYAWARQAPKLSLPNGVGYHIGGHTGISYLVLQVHYLNSLNRIDRTGLNILISRQPQPSEAGMYLMLADSGKIPGHRSKVHLDVSCRFDMSTIIPFAFRTHAHDISRTIVAYHFSMRTREMRMIGRGNPQWPQAFYPTNDGIVIERGDFLLARCIYDSSDRGRATYIGSTHEDEMCNFYIMYERPAGAGGNYDTSDCAENRYPELWDKVPENSMALAPKAPPAIKSFVTNANGGNGGGGGVTTGGDDTRVADLSIMPNWAVQEKIGQVGGLAVDTDNQLLVLHRADRSWGVGTFDEQFRFRGKASDLGVDGTPQPIADSPLIRVNPLTGVVVDRWGAGLFYLPHGLFVEQRSGGGQRRVWMTDVGSHQVLRFDWGQWTKPSLVLGVRLEPGNDHRHFCQPADVAVNSKGEIFVADGYCNSRIVKFSPDGHYLHSWPSGSRTGDFQIVHSLALVESLGLVCAADRERVSIECFDFEGGFKKRYSQLKAFGGPIYAIVWHEKHKRLYGVSDKKKSSLHPSDHAHIFSLDLETGLAEENTWGQRFLSRPHDMAVSPDGACLYVGEIGPNLVLKFHVNGAQEAGASDNGVSDKGALYNKVGGKPARPQTSQSTSYPSSSGILNSTGKQHQGTARTLLTSLTHGRTSLVIGLFLVIPVVVVLIVVLLLRAGAFCCFRRSGSVKNRRYGPMFKERNGFQPLNQDESDMEGERLTGDMSAAGKAKA